MPSGGSRKGSGRKPAPDQSKEFEEQAFDGLVNSQAVQQAVAPEQNRPA